MYTDEGLFKYCSNYWVTSVSGHYTPLKATKHNTHWFRRLCVPRRHLLFCRVTLGKSFLQFNAMKMAHSPPGHHSVTGRPSVNGLALSEYVIYRGEQVTHLSSVCFCPLCFLHMGLFVWDFDLANAACVSCPQLPGAFKSTQQTVLWRKSSVVMVNVQAGILFFL